MFRLLRLGSYGACSALAPAIVALLLAASCGGVRPASTATLAPEEATRMFAAGYSNIEDMYISKVDLSELAVAGLSNLTKLDPELTVRQTGRHVDIDVAGHPAGGFDSPEAQDIEDWASVTAGAISLARTASAELSQDSPDDVYKAVFDGMLGKLDRFSRYSTPESAREHRAAREGFGGIGVRVTVEEEGVRVSSVMSEGPGGRGGLKPDDLITHIDEEPVLGIDLQTIIQRLRGPVGSRVSLRLARQGGVETIWLTRAHIVPETVVYERRGSVAHVRLYSFNQDTTRTLSAAIRRARKEIGPKIAGLVLDLRDNPGGLLDQAVEVSDLFMESGRIVTTRGRHPDSHQRFDATHGDIVQGLPIVVLVNGNSASASEIVAAALQDSSRAVVAGTTSYGKGTVQTVIRMPNQGELTLTWARFHAPSGYTIHHLGVLPSVCTSRESKAQSILDALEEGKLSPLPITLRNSATPEDVSTLDRLRAGCPARKTDEPVDVDVAVKLVENGALYRRALSLGIWADTATASVSEGAGRPSAIALELPVVHP
ncbi:MAG TPA: S41 family peptidase [Alphaproteobacteria bacterium]|nr:S41 family peptidase [Alphaproteobacteria bacterium]